MQRAGRGGRRDRAHHARVDIHLRKVERAARDEPAPRRALGGALGWRWRGLQPTRAYPRANGRAHEPAISAGGSVSSAWSGVSKRSSICRT